MLNCHSLILQIVKFSKELPSLLSNSLGTKFETLKLFALFRTPKLNFNLALETLEPKINV